MKTKSIPVRSCRKSLAPSPSLPERFGSGEIVPDTCDVDERRVPVPHKKRHCRLVTDRVGSEPFTSDACIVCGVSDMLVSRCSGIDCLVRFHGECLTPEFGGSKDLANPFCPYCWFTFVALRCESWRNKAIAAEKAVSKYLDKDIASDHRLQGENADCSSKEDQVRVDKDSDQQEEDGGRLEVCSGMKEDRVIDDDVVASAEDEERVATDNVQDPEDDNESIEVQTKVNTEVRVDKDSEQPDEDEGKLEVCTGMKEDKVIDDDVEASAEYEEREERVATDNVQDVEGDDESAEVQSKANTNVSLFLSIQESYSGKELDQVQQNEERRRRRVEMDATDSEISLTKERNGKTVRDFSFFDKDQRRRLLWTSEEEEMLRVGVEKFAGEAKKNMPWRKILEMGENVFHETRTPDNLKDKWRNMLKAQH